jgi:CHAD domain-containing protein
MNDPKQQAGAPAQPSKRPPRLRPSRQPERSIAARLHERIQVFESALGRTKAAEDGEAIHDLRVASRRLVAFIRTWRDLLPQPVCTRVLRDLRTVRRRLNPSRDLEVEVELLKGRLESQGQINPKIRLFLEDLGRQLERERVRAAERLRPKRMRRLVGRLAEAEHALRVDLLSQLQAFEGAHHRERKRRGAALAVVRRALETEEDELLHDARIEVKKWRYSLESIGSSEILRTGPLLDSMRDLQDVLGTINDRATLRASLRRRIREAEDHGLVEALITMMERLDTERAVEVARFRGLADVFLRTLPPELRSPSGSAVVPSPRETPADEPSVPTSPPDLPAATEPPRAAGGERRP